VALAKLELRDRDCLLLCSDGLTGHVTDDEIREVVTTRRPADAARVLVDMANERGGKDNITVVVAGIGGRLESVRPGEAVEETLEVISTFEAKVPKG
jgi:serine/threonine protein phosphatase PrpC